MMMLKYEVGETVTLKKSHACGENQWKIIKTGVDIKLECLGCSRLILLERPEFERRLRRVLVDGKWIAVINRK